jgi:hypothetical protein
VHRKPACGLVRGRRWTPPECDAGEGRPPRFLGNPSTRVPRSSTPMGVARPCLGRTDHCGLPTNLRRRPPPHAPLRGSITRPTCVLSTLHDEGHPIAMQDSLPACWLGVDWAGLTPAGFQPRISRGSSATSFPIEPGFPGAQILYASKKTAAVPPRTPIVTTCVVKRETRTVEACSGTVEVVAERRACRMFGLR